MPSRVGIFRSWAPPVQFSSKNVHCSLKFWLTSPVSSRRNRPKGFGSFGRFGPNPNIEYRSIKNTEIEAEAEPKFSPDLVGTAFTVTELSGTEFTRPHFRD